MKENIKIRFIVFEKDGVHHFIQKNFDIKNSEENLSKLLVDIEKMITKFNPYK